MWLTYAVSICLLKENINVVSKKNYVVRLKYIIVLNKFFYCRFEKYGYE